MNYKIPDLKQSNFLRKQFRKRYSVRPYTDYYGTRSPRKPLWENFSDYVLISWDTASELVSSMPEVYVMWENSPLSVSRKLQKSQMISACGSQLARAIRDYENSIHTVDLGDIYCISADMSRYVVFTRVFIGGIGNICLTSEKDIPDTGILGGAALQLKPAPVSASPRP